MNLNDYRKCFELSFDQFILENSVRDAQIKENLSYEKLTGVVRVELDNSQFFFFKEGKLKLIYTSNEGVANRIWKEFLATVGNNPEDVVRSRAGKTSNQRIFAKHGFTVSTTTSDVDFVEIYPPCSLKLYLENIYRDVPLFIR
ncbi:hypothetical protein WBG78_20540 [Chryseolinea sp. T2]|uniref:hypothetical protein n=1 Tax=Chryseolinea sp. T2 TaxID=3129255 RepID=UPI003077C7F6